MRGSTAESFAPVGRFAGVSWDASGYEVAAVAADGSPVTEEIRFSVDLTAEMISFLVSLGPDAVAVVDSTNGTIDGRMMAAGLTVYRADPWVLPERPLFGSVPATALAGAAQRDLATLTKLERGRGTQTGREADLASRIAESAAATAALSGMGRGLSHGTRKRRDVALTFDDGPLPPYTGHVMDLLERFGVPATFFCVGLNAGAYRDEIARMSKHRHGIGNHTWSHPLLPELSRPQLMEQINRTNETIAGAGAAASPRLFRPPYGSQTPEVTGWLGETDLTVVLWDIDPFDWAMPGSAEIARIVVEETQPGSVILLHDGGGDRSQTVASLPAIIEGLLDRGYRFVLVDELVRVLRVAEDPHGGDP